MICETQPIMLQTSPWSGVYGRDVDLDRRAGFSGQHRPRDRRPLSAGRDAGRGPLPAFPISEAVLVNNAGAFDIKPVTTSEGHNQMLAINLLSPSC
jgi:hypothetical protein